MRAERNGDISFWFADIGGLPARRASLSGNIDVDVAIVGAGYTGLWTALYLKKAQPSLRIAILEREFAGFGASGRNGGWVSGAFSWSREKYLKNASRSAVIAMQEAMAGAVEEILRMADAEGIDADIRRVDRLLVATNAAQIERMRGNIATLREWGVGPSRANVLDEASTKSRLNIQGALGSLLLYGQACVQPAKLVRGLAEAVVRAGVAIFEQTTVTRIHPGLVKTNCATSARKRSYGRRRGLRRVFQPRDGHGYR
jgi:glycine/D-amino acid oxidase-like deaminating enzyme